jgi:hypothetical protein
MGSRNRIATDVMSKAKDGMSDNIDPTIKYNTARESEQPITDSWPTKSYITSHQSESTSIERSSYQIIRELVLPVI